MDKTLSILYSLEGSIHLKYFSNAIIRGLLQNIPEVHVHDTIMVIPYSAIIGWGKILVKSSSQRNGGEIFGECRFK